MSNGYFDFKQFRIRHDRCAMKVGTDAVLLGAWADLNNSLNILDIGCGSGIIALMAAQRAPHAKVMGVDVDTAAVAQANENAQASPFADRVTFVCGDIRCYPIGAEKAHLQNNLDVNKNENVEPFDCILCNPPFYTEDTLPPSQTRALARNNHELPFDELIDAVLRLLSEDGCFHVILPASSEPFFHQICVDRGLHLKRKCLVKTTERKAPKRVLSSYSMKKVQEPIMEVIALMENGEKSKAYSMLTNDFYLDCQ